MPFKFPGEEEPSEPQSGAAAPLAGESTPVLAPLVAKTSNESVPPSDRFSSFMPFIFEWEGGYDHDPNDPGGKTWFGIDYASHPHSEIWELAERRTGADGKRNEEMWDKAREIAREIYRTSYWNKNHCDDLPFPIGEVVMNIAVNAGAKRAGEWLQKIVGANVDGAIGPATVEATVAHGHPEDVARVLIARTETHYVGLAESSTKLRTFLKGWLNRNNALKTYLHL